MIVSRVWPRASDLPVVVFCSDKSSPAIGRMKRGKTRVDEIPQPSPKLSRHREISRREISKCGSSGFTGLQGLALLAANFFKTADVQVEH